MSRIFRTDQEREQDVRDERTADAVAFIIILIIVISLIV